MLPDEPASEPEEEENDKEDSASDDDEYVGERGEDASDVEDAVMENVEATASSSRSQRQKQSDAGISKEAGDAVSEANAIDSKKNENDKNAHRRASENARRTSSSSKPSTGPRKGSPRKLNRPSDASTEEARSRARKVLATALEKIFGDKETKDAQEADDEQETDQNLAEAYAALLEEELFETNADVHGSTRVVGTKYKDRFRTFLFSLKDAKNTTLHSRIASGVLKATELAKMSNQELANDSIRQATEKARLEALHRSTLRAEEAGPMRKITHKGEIEIESDALVARDQPGKFQRAERPAATRVSESEPVLPASTEQVEGDSSDSEPGTSERYTTRASAPASGFAQGSPTRVNFGDVWTKSTEMENQNDDDEPQESLGFDVGSPHDDVYDQSTIIDAEPTSGADDFIDSFLDGPEENDNGQTATTDQAASSQVAERSTTPETQPSSEAVHRYRRVIWNGLIDLPDVFAFQGHVKQVAGRSLGSASRVWSKFFPERPLLIAGRLPSKAAIDYLLQVVNAPKTELLAFTMEPGACKDGVARPQESDHASFDGMLKHFKNADRWGALHISSSVKGSLIKDFYVVPLNKDEEVPLWLDMAESDCLGGDWHTKRDCDLLVLVAVVIRDALQAELSRAERSEGRHRNATNDGERQRQASHTHVEATPAEDEGYNPTAGLSIPFGNANATVAGVVPAAAPAAFGSDALQSLLRTLGKTTAAPPAGGVVANASGGRSPLPPGPPPPGPPPGPPPSFGGIPPAAGLAPTAGSWSPHPGVGAGAEAATPPQPWAPQQAHAPQQYGYAGPAEQQPHGPNHGWEQEGWNAAHEAAPQPQELPEEEYPGQYNPDFLAQASSGVARGGAAFGSRGRGHGYGRPNHGPGAGRGGWGGGRGW